MPYVVLVVGTLGLVAIWMSYRTNRLRARAEMVEKPRSVFEDDSYLQFLGSLVGSAVVVWAMWGWGVSAIEQNNANAVAEEIWLASFNSEHQRQWDTDCLGILFRQGAEGVIYNPDSGEAYTVDWCQAQWQQPGPFRKGYEYSTDTDDQPERTPPFASWALFGQDHTEYRCIDQALQECYGWGHWL